MKKEILLFLLIYVFLSNILYAKNIKFVGSIVSNGQKMIGTKYMGYVSKVHVNIGDKVQKEDKLYEIESAEFDLAKVQSELMVDQAKLFIEYWKNKVSVLDKKKQRLQAKKYNGFDFDLEVFDLDSQSDNALVMLEAAKIGMKNSIEKTKEIMTIFSYLKMKAPSDGVIVERNIKVGDMVMPGMIAIKMVDTNDLYADISISESLLRYFYVGKKATIKLRSLDKVLTGKVQSIVPSSNSITHKVKVRISIDQKHPRILPGMYSEVFLDIPYK